jgi:hypothetical protein
MESLQTEVAGNVAAMAKCAHVDCICTVLTGERFCSDYCAEQSGASKAQQDGRCECGHTECVHAEHGMALPPAALPA